MVDADVLLESRSVGHDALQKRKQACDKLVLVFALAEHVAALELLFDRFEQLDLRLLGEYASFADLVFFDQPIEQKEKLGRETQQARGVFLGAT